MLIIIEGWTDVWSDVRLRGKNENIGYYSGI